MWLTGHAAAALATRHCRTLPDGFTFHRSEWIASGQDATLSPTVFLVEQPPGSELGAHFHEQNQFQVVRRGSGWIGPHAVGPGSVHYAGAYTGYGPVRAGDTGLDYFTLRTVYEVGAHLLPQQRSSLLRGPKRHMQGPPLPSLGVHELSTLEAVRTVDLIAAQSDALHAQCWYVPPDVSIEGPAVRGSGQFQLVLAGGVMGEGGVAPWECRFLCPREPSQAVQASSAGLQLLVLQMPLKAPEYSKAIAV